MSWNLIVEIIVSWFVFSRVELGLNISSSPVQVSIQSIAHQPACQFPVFVKIIATWKLEKTAINIQQPWMLQWKAWWLLALLWPYIFPGDPIFFPTQNSNVRIFFPNIQGSPLCFLKDEFRSLVPFQARVVQSDSCRWVGWSSTSYITTIFLKKEIKSEVKVLITQVRLVSRLLV